MPRSPCVSVIIPTYNHRDYVAETLESVFAQTFTDYEIIVVNDGSPDDTAAVLRPYVASSRIRYLEQPNAGQAAARNRGLAEATGEFVAFLDDDDRWLPDKLQWQIAFLRNHPECLVVFGQFEPIGQVLAPKRNSPPLRMYSQADILSDNPILSPGQTLIRTPVLRQVGGFDPAIWGADDWDLYLRLSRISPFAGLSKVALQYRFHEGNASKDFLRMRKNILVALRKNCHPLLHWRNWRRARLRFALAFAGRATYAGFRFTGKYEALLGTLGLPSTWRQKRSFLGLVFPRWVYRLMCRLGLAGKTTAAFV